MVFLMFEFVSLIVLSVLASVSFVVVQQKVTKPFKSKIPYWSQVSISARGINVFISQLVTLQICRYPLA